MDYPMGGILFGGMNALQAFANNCQDYLIKFCAAHSSGSERRAFTVLNPLFLTVFFGTAAVCLLLAIYSLVRWQSAGPVCLLAESILYIAGTFIVTIAFNVPRNKTLVRVNISEPEAIRIWQGYITGWTRWNHVRTVAALTAAIFFTVVLSQL